MTVAVSTLLTQFDGVWLMLRVKVGVNSVYPTGAAPHPLGDNTSKCHVYFHIGCTTSEYLTCLPYSL